MKLNVAGNVVSGREVTFVNVISLRLECSIVLREGLIVSVSKYRSETMLWRERKKIFVREKW